MAEAHASLGQITIYSDWDFSGGEREYQRAIALDPNYPTAHQWRAENLSTLGRYDEALAEIRRALELDPLSLIINRVYGDILVNARRYDEAIEQYRRTLELDPNFTTAHFFLARAYEATGRYDQAFDELVQSYGGGFVTPEKLSQLRTAYARSGWKGYLQVSLTQLLQQSKKEYVPPSVIAIPYAQLGQKEEAFAWLERAYQERDFRLRHLKDAFEFDPIRSDPRFDDLVRRVGLNP